MYNCGPEQAYYFLMKKAPDNTKTGQDFRSAASNAPKPCFFCREIHPKDQAIQARSQLGNGLKKILRIKFKTIKYQTRSKRRIIKKSPVLRWFDAFCMKIRGYVFVLHDLVNGGPPHCDFR